MESGDFLMLNETGWRLIFQGGVQAGFPSPAADYAEEEIDLKSYLMPNPHATFIMKVAGESMKEANIPPGAHLVIDRTLAPANNSIIVGVINGEFTCKRLIKNGMEIILQPENKNFNPIKITEDMEFTVWGTVTRIIIDATKI